MKTFTALATLAAVAQAVVGQQPLTINTPPNAVLCEPLQLSWIGGTAPYFLSLIPAGQPSAPAIKQFPTQSGNTYTWVVDLQANTNFNIALKDSTGQTAFSALTTVNAGTNSSCINTSVQEGTATDGAAPTTAGSGSSGSAGATTPAGSSASASAKSSGSSSGASASQSASSKSNSAVRGSANTAFGIAVVMGLVGAALF